MDFYKVLNISRSASKAEIKSAYRLLALKFHPDRHLTNKDIAAFRFNHVATAYQTLGNPDLKIRYDNSIGNRLSDWPRQYVKKHNRTTTAPSGPRANIRKEQYDVKLWNVWHYGDDPEKYAAVSARQTQRPPGSNPLEDRTEYNNDTEHHYYRANRREREAENFRNGLNNVVFHGGVRYDALTAEQEQRNEHEHMDAASEKLHYQREMRRSKDTER